MREEHAGEVELSKDRIHLLASWRFHISTR
jgi:hypothetical protein